MKFSVTLVSLLAVYVAAVPTPGKGKGKVVNADVDPNKAPGIAQNARDYAADHGGQWKQSSYGDRNDDKTTNANRDAAFAQHDTRYGGHQGSVEEYPPARYRDPNEDLYTKDVGIDEQRHQGGTYGQASRKANDGDTLSFGVKGENPPSGTDRNVGGHNLRPKGGN